MLIPTEEEADDIVIKLNALDSLHWKLYLSLFDFFLQGILHQNSWRIFAYYKELTIWKKCLSKIFYLHSAYLFGLVVEILHWKSIFHQFTFQIIIIWFKHHSLSLSDSFFYISSRAFSYANCCCSYLILCFALTFSILSCRSSSKQLKPVSVSFFGPLQYFGSFPMLLRI